MTQIFNTNIAGSVGNLANSGESFTQNASMNIGVGDWSALEQRLSQFGLTSTELASMKADLDTTAQRDEKVKTEVAGSWIGRLTGKVASGAFGVGIEVAAAGIAKAIAEYLGLPGA